MGVDIIIISTSTNFDTYPVEQIPETGLKPASEAVIVISSTVPVGYNCKHEEMLSNWNYYLLS